MVKSLPPVVNVFPFPFFLPPKLSANLFNTKWCGKCIGESNMMAFSTFVGMLCFQGYLLAGIFIYWIVTCYVVAGAPRGPGFRPDQ